MAYVSSGLRQATKGGLSGREGAIWNYTSTDASTAVTSAAYFTRAGAGSQGNSNNSVGLKIGDVVIVQESSAGASPWRTTIHSVKTSTANFSSSMASSAWGTYGFDCTITSST